MSLRELREEEANKKKLLANVNLIEKLSDKGERIKKGLETVQKLIAQKESEHTASSQEGSPSVAKVITPESPVPIVVLTEEQLFPSLKDQRKIDLFAADTRDILERKAREELDNKQRQKKELQDMLRYGKRGLSNVRERKTMKMISTEEALKLEISVQEKEKVLFSLNVDDDDDDDEDDEEEEVRSSLLLSVALDRFVLVCMRYCNQTERFLFQQTITTPPPPLPLSSLSLSSPSITSNQRRITNRRSRTHSRSEKRRSTSKESQLVLFLRTTKRMLTKKKTKICSTLMPHAMKTTKAQILERMFFSVN